MVELLVLLLEELSSKLSFLLQYLIVKVHRLWELVALEMQLVEVEVEVVVVEEEEAGVVERLQVVVGVDYMFLVWQVVVQALLAVELVLKEIVLALKEMMQALLAVELALMVI